MTTPYGFTTNFTDAMDAIEIRFTVDDEVVATGTIRPGTPATDYSDLAIAVTRHTGEETRYDVHDEIFQLLLDLEWFVLHVDLAVERSL